MWNSILIEPARAILKQTGDFVSSLAGMVLILVVGWLIARLAQNVVTRFLRVLRFDSIADQIGANNILAKGGIKYTLSELLGILCYWLTVLVALVVAVNAVGLTVAAELLNKIILYVPNIIAAIFLLVVGIFGATFLGGIVQASAANAGLGQAKFLGRLTEVIIIIFAVAIALEQLDIGTVIIGLAVNIILVSIGLGLALAFGLGCKDIAGKYIEDFINNLKSKGG